LCGWKGVSKRCKQKPGTAPYFASGYEDPADIVALLTVARSL
jgi:hypothetical protein